MSRPLAGILGGAATAVVTGQQAGLLGGPLYTLGKLLGAVALARARSACPVFWIECDDADVREVDQVTLPDGQGEPRLLTLGEPDDGRPVAARALAPRIAELLDEAAALVGAGEAAAAAIADLRAAYVPGRHWQDAFGRYLGTLAEGLGVVFIDPSTAAVKQAAAPLFARILAETDAVEQALAEGAAAVPDPQVAALPGELPVFLLDGEGRRRKLTRRADGGFGLKGGDAVLARNELGELLARSPERFSAGVLLRPVLQDFLLPTAAYVAGPAESRYHEQTGPLYRLLGVAKPEVVPRPHLLLVEARVRRSLEKLGAGLEDGLAGEAVLRERAARAQSGIDPRAEAESALAAAQAAIAPHLQRLRAVDPAQLGKPLEEAEAGIAYHLRKAGARAEAVLERRDQDLVAHARKVARAILPGGEPQERVYPAVLFLARRPRQDLVATILAAIDPSELGRQLVIDL